MKRYLLDSHTLIWSIVDDSKLSTKVLKILQDKNNELLVSSVSFWEIAIKAGKGKLDLKNFNIHLLPDYCRKLEIKQISLKPDEAIRYASLAIFEEHKDPFDRMLICQCLKNGFTLISKDSKMKIYEKEGLDYVW